MSKKHVKCVLVGCGGVGKTSLILTYLNKKFPTENPLPTIQDISTVDVLLSGTSDTHIELEIVDTANCEDYDRLRPLFYPDTDIFLLLCSISYPESFEYAYSMYLPELRHHRPDTPIILVGTKADLRNHPIDSLKTHQSHPTTRAQGLEFSRRMEAIHYFECSALKSAEEVTAIFNAAIVAGLRLESNERNKRCSVM
jgi:small GTP-binding protein